MIFADGAAHNDARHSDGFSLRLRHHYKAARASGVKPLSAESRKRIKGLAIGVNIEVTVSILFGLEIWVFATLQIVKGVLMENSFVKSCVWCGVAFLRGHGGTLPIQTRDYQLPSICPARRNVERFESSPSHQFHAAELFAA